MNKDLYDYDNYEYDDDDDYYYYYKWFIMLNKQKNVLLVATALQLMLACSVPDVHCFSPEKNNNNHFLNKDSLDIDLKMNHLFGIEAFKSSYHLYFNYVYWVPTTFDLFGTISSFKNIDCISITISKHIHNKVSISRQK